MKNPIVSRLVLNSLCFVGLWVPLRGTWFVCALQRRVDRYLAQERHRWYARHSR